MADLYGRWYVQIDGEAGGASVQLQKDPDQDDSLVGSITRPATKGQRDKPALLAGEVQNGDFNLEESDDGVRISATWTGQVVEASCGKEIKGTWTNTTNDMGKDSVHAFVLRKQAGWQ
ncbi:hypothetical protein [Rhodoferax sp.]|uniref:hypothetical protein n=1 Tax=Rhodoferax sp. TaxID=50421 RepID=UPI00374CD2E6